MYYVWPGSPHHKGHIWEGAYYPLCLIFSGTANYVTLSFAETKVYGMRSVPSSLTEQRSHYTTVSHDVVLDAFVLFTFASPTVEVTWFDK